MACCVRAYIAQESQCNCRDLAVRRNFEPATRRRTSSGVMLDFKGEKRSRSSLDLLSNLAVALLAPTSSIPVRLIVFRGLNRVLASTVGYLGRGAHPEATAMRVRVERAARGPLSDGRNRGIGTCEDSGI